MSETRRFCRSLKLCWCLFRLTLLKKNFDNFIIFKQKDSVILKSHCLFVLTSFFLSLLHITKLLRIFVENQFREILKTPVFKAFYTVHAFQEKAFWNLSAFQAVFYLSLIHIYKSTRAIAKALQVSQPTIVRKLHKYGLTPKEG